MSTSGRTLEQVEEVLQAAKLSMCDLAPQVYEVSFAPALNENIVFFEVDEGALNDLLSGECYLAGEAEDQAVICSGNTTYSVREGETSNLVLPVAGTLSTHFDEDETQLDMEDSCARLTRAAVVTMQHLFYEMKLAVPRLQSVHAKLQAAAGGVTLDELLDSVQASEAEILTRLKRLNAYPVNGKWHLLTFTDLADLTSHMVTLAEENCWPLDALPKPSVLETLASLFPEAPAAQVLSVVAQEDDEGRLSVREDAVCRIFAEILLRNVEKFSYNDFMTVWQQSVPRGMTPDLSQLAGVAVIDEFAKPKTIWFCDINTLPEDPKQRLQMLFTQKSKWTLDEISPFLQDTLPPKQSASALLIKFCRSVQHNGVKCFSLR